MILRIDCSIHGFLILILLVENINSQINKYIFILCFQVTITFQEKNSVMSGIFLTNIVFNNLRTNLLMNEDNNPFANCMISFEKYDICISSELY